MALPKWFLQYKGSWGWWNFCSVKSFTYNMYLTFHWSWHCAQNWGLGHILCHRPCCEPLPLALLPTSPYVYKQPLSQRTSDIAVLCLRVKIKYITVGFKSCARKYTVGGWSFLLPLVRFWTRDSNDCEL